MLFVHPAPFSLESAWARTLNRKKNDVQTIPGQMGHCLHEEIEEISTLLAGSTRVSRRVTRQGGLTRLDYRFHVNAYKHLTAKGLPAAVIQLGVKSNPGSFINSFDKTKLLFTHVKPVKVYVHTHVKITRQWKSTFRLGTWVQRRLNRASDVRGRALFFGPPHGRWFSLRFKNFGHEITFLWPTDRVMPFGFTPFLFWFDAFCIFRSCLRKRS